jgi:hypothetical protein
MRRRLVIALAVGLALTAGACASRAEDGALGTSDPATTTTGGATTTTAAATDPPTDECRAGDLDPAALESLVVDEREGFQLEADDVGDTGPSDLAKAIHDDEQDDAAQVMADLGFRRGYQRYWTNDAGGGLVVFVYEFCDGLGALTYGDRVLDYVDDLSPFEVVGAAGARGISGTRDDVIVAYVSGVSGSTLVLSVANGPEGAAELDEVRASATSLLVDQIAALG